MGLNDMLSDGVRGGGGGVPSKGDLLKIGEKGEGGGP